MYLVGEDIDVNKTSTIDVETSMRGIFYSMCLRDINERHILLHVPQRYQWAAYFTPCASEISMSGIFYYMCLRDINERHILLHVPQRHQWAAYFTPCASETSMSGIFYSMCLRDINERHILLHVPQRYQWAAYFTPCASERHIIILLAFYSHTCHRILLTCSHLASS